MQEVARHLHRTHRANFLVRREQDLEWAVLNCAIVKYH